MHSYALMLSELNLHSTRVNNPNSTLITSRVEPGTSELKIEECGRAWSDREIAVLLVKWSDETIQ